jgi:hypothetical protein
MSLIIILMLMSGCIYAEIVIFRDIECGKRPLQGSNKIGGIKIFLRY